MKKLIYLFFTIAIIMIAVISVSAKNGDTFYFGSYPQTSVTDSTLISKLNSLSLSWNYYDDYAAESVSNKTAVSIEIGQYADVSYNGAKYRAVKFNQYRPFATTLLTDAYNSYQFYNGFEIGKVYWYKFEPLKWVVIDEASGLVTTEKVVDAIAYENEVEEGESEAFTYSSSSLKKWLNGAFFKTAFSSTEKESIKTPEDTSSEGNINVFSVSSISTAFSTASKRLSSATGYALCQGVFTDENVATWWLKGDNDTDSTVYAVNSIGEVTDLEGLANITGIGVRPTMKMFSIFCKHSYTTNVTKATTSKDGLVEKKCTGCGLTASKTTIKKIGTMSISASSFVCDGTVKKPTVTVKDSSGKVIQSTNYTLKWATTSKAIGIHKVTITFKENYSGSKTFSYKIIPAQVSNLSLKLTDNGNVEISYSAVKGSPTYNIYYSLYSDKKYQLLKSTTKTSFTAVNLTSGKKYYFKVVATKVVDGTKYTGKYSSVKNVTISDGGIAIKNGRLYSENGFTYIKDNSTGVKFMIVNKTYSIPSSYAPGGLKSDCASAFSKLCAAAKSDGVTIKSISGYRSYSRQTDLYNGYVARDGKTKADTYSARPGHSEHQTGLAIDCNSLKYSFADTKEGKWLAANCYKYGFVIRYAKSKIAYTGYQYEPWHIRYLGSVELATKITKSGLCIEEYYGITSKY